MVVDVTNQRKSVHHNFTKTWNYHITKHKAETDSADGQSDFRLLLILHKC